MQKTALYILFFWSAVMLWPACQARRVGKDQTMVKKVFIKCKNPDVDKADMYGYVKQKPNRRIFWLPLPKRHVHQEGQGPALYLHIYNMVNPKRELKRQKRRNERFDKRNRRRHNRGKNDDARKWKTIGEILWSIGEAPVILDTSLTKRTVRQFDQYLDNKGYFNSTVRDSLVYTRWQRLIGRQKKAIVWYIVEPAPAYTVRKIDWQISDQQMAYYLNDLVLDTLSYLIKRGENYDVDVLQAERDRITRHLRNTGYYKFSRDFVRFTIDSSLNTHQVDITISIRKPKIQVNDTTQTEVDHQRYEIRNVTVCTAYRRPGRNVGEFSYDTLRDGLQPIMLYDSVLKIKPEVLRERIFLAPNLIYRDSLSDLTYRSLTSLQIYRQVDISYREVGNGKLDCRINLTPLSRQSFIAQMEGTNTAGNLGIGGSFAYQNNNTFHGAERFEFRIKGGTEAQQPLTEVEQSTEEQLVFNTIEAGADVTLNVPRAFFPFNKLPIKKAEDRRTIFQTSYNYQSRIDYDRSIGNLSYGYSFRVGRLSRLSIYPIEFNLVKVNPRAGLEALLNSNQDPLLRYRFTDHMTNDFRISYLKNTQNIKKGGNANYLRVDLESSGNMVRGIYKLTNEVPDSLGSYRIGGIPFAQYLRFFVDYRHYYDLGDHQRIVVRIAHGVGWALDNFPTLPLEKSFYGGGANGIRAWEARSLGPGSWQYDRNAVRYAQFGDIQAEYNIELRFKISKTLQGALFADGGNIWLLKEDATRPNAAFKFNRFINDLAFGPGAGVRYDLGFFIFRLDWAFRLRDPSYPIGERWWIPGQRKLGNNLNFGIGYPF